jgi:hypothetical protein
MYQVGEAAVWTLGRLGQAGHVTEGPVNTGKRSIARLNKTAMAPVGSATQRRACQGTPPGHCRIASSAHAVDLSL